MGLFDRFKRQSKPPDPVQVAAPLAFERAGCFEVASCPGKFALNHLEELRQKGLSAGFTVILLGGKEDVDRLAENREFSKTSPEACLRLAAEVDVEAWVKEHFELASEDSGPEADGWPETPASGSISAHLEVLSRKPKKTVYIAKIPTARNWEAPAYIGMGGWNECPDSAVLTAFSKRWHERYGAEVVSITHDVMEFSVASPPGTREEALALAREQYALCADIVDQGVGDITNLAATLLNSKYWYFWWD